MVGSLLKSRAETMDTISKVLARVIPLERPAFSLDSDKGQVTTIKYVTPEMKKPPNAGLSVDSWDDNARNNAENT